MSSLNELKQLAGPESLTQDQAEHLLDVLVEVNQGDRFELVKPYLVPDNADKWCQRLDFETRTQIELLNELGKISRRSREAALARKFYSLALELAEAHHPEKMFDLQLNLANLELYTGNFSDAKNSYEKLLDEKLQEDLKSLVKLNLSTCVYNMGDISTAEQLLEECIPGFSEDSVEKTNATFNLATLRMNQRRFEEAEDLFSQCADYYLQHDLGRRYIITQEQVIKIQIALHHSAEAVEATTKALDQINAADYRLYCRIGSLTLLEMADDLIVKYFSPLLSIAIDQKEPREVFQVLFKICQVSLKNGKALEQVEQQLANLYKIASTIDDTEALRMIYVQQLWLDYRTENFNRLNMELAKRIKDKTMSEQERFEFGALSFLVGEFKRSIRFLKSMAKPRSWDSGYIRKVNLIYYLAHLYSDQNLDVNWDSMPNLPRLNIVVNCLALVEESIRPPSISDIDYQTVENTFSNQENILSLLEVVKNPIDEKLVINSRYLEGLLILIQ